MKKQTAVEWLRCQLDELEMTKNKRSLVLQYDLISEAFNQALEMERQQIIDAHKDNAVMYEMDATAQAEHYYTQTFTEPKND
jgi:hypothetical protein